MEIEFPDEEVFSGSLLDEEIYIALREMVESAGLRLKYAGGKVTVFLPVNLDEL